MVSAGLSHHGDMFGCACLDRNHWRVAAWMPFYRERHRAVNRHEDDVCRGDLVLVCELGMSLVSARLLGKEIAPEEGQSTVAEARVGV